MGTQLLERMANAGITAPRSVVENARAYAQLHDCAPSWEQIAAAARTIGIRPVLLAGIVYAHVAEKENKDA